MKVYSECVKLAKNHDRKVVVIEFLEFLAENGYVVAQYHKRHNYDELLSAGVSNDSLAHQFLEIDEKKLEQERRKIVDDLQNGK